MMMFRSVARLSTPARLMLVRASSAASSTALIRELRQRTNAGVVDCKKALDATEGDMDKAVEWLRKKGVASASKLSSRVSADGVIAASKGNGEAVLVEVNTETDFVARNSKFQTFVSSIFPLAHAAPTAESADPNTNSYAVATEALLPHQVLDVVVNTQVPLTEALKSLAANFGENVTLNRVVKVKVANPERGAVGIYVHNKVTEGMGQIGAAVAVEATASNLSSEQREVLQKAADQLSLHIVGSVSKYLSIDLCKGPEVESERAVHLDVAKQSGKPDNVVEKMVEGKMKKFYEENVLLEQKSVVEEGSPKIADWLKSVAKKSNLGEVKVVAFARMKIGEKVQQQQQQQPAQ